MFKKVAFTAAALFGLCTALLPNDLWHDTTLCHLLPDQTVECHGKIVEAEIRLRDRVAVAVADILAMPEALAYSHGSSNGWTPVPFTVGTGVCGASPTYTGTCFAYISPTGAGTAATCFVPATASGPDPAFPDASKCPWTPTNMALVRNGTNDWLIFARGGVFRNIAPTLQTASGIQVSGGTAPNFPRYGRSPTAPLVVIGFGDPTLDRPRFEMFSGNCIGGSGGSLASPVGSNLMQVSIDCYSPWNDPNSTDYVSSLTISAPTTGAATTTMVAQFATAGNVVYLNVTSAPVSGLTLAAGVQVFDNGLIAPGQMIASSGTCNGACTGAGGVGTYPLTVSALCSSVAYGTPCQNAIGSATWSVCGTSCQLTVTSVPANLIPLVAIANQNNTAAMPTGTLFKLWAISGNTLYVQATVVNGQTVNAGDTLSVYTNSGGGYGSNGNFITWQLIEDCLIRYNAGGGGFVIVGASQPGINFIIRRNLILDSWSPVSRSQGTFIGDTLPYQGYVLFEQNMVIHNGWTQSNNLCTPGQNNDTAVCPSGLPSVTPWAGGAGNQSQGVYIHDNMGYSYVHENIFIGNANVGVQQRPGGAMINNTFIRNAVGYSGGAGIANQIYQYNVLTEAGNLYASSQATTGPTPTNVLNFANTTQAVVGDALFDATNPAALAANCSVSSVTKTTLTASCSTASVTAGDVIMSMVVQQWGMDFASYSRQVTIPGTGVGSLSNGVLTLTSVTNTYGPVQIGQNVLCNGTLVGTVTGYGTPASGAGFSGTFNVSNNASCAGTIFIYDPTVRTNLVDSNVFTYNVPAANGGGLGGFSISPGNQAPRGSAVVSNNFMYSGWQAIQDNSLVASVDLTGCGGSIRIGIGNFPGSVQSLANSWLQSDIVTVSGVQGATNANGTWPITFPDTTHMCLVGSPTTLPSAWTSGTGVVNGGVQYSGNYAGAMSTASDARVSFASTTLVPAGTPTIESYDTLIGGNGHLQDLESRIRKQSKTNWDNRLTANAINNYFRQTICPVASPGCLPQLAY